MCVRNVVEPENLIGYGTNNNAEIQACSIAIKLAHKVGMDVVCLLLYII